MRVNVKPLRMATAAAALLAGCSMMPAYERPPAPVPQAWPAPAAAAGAVAADLDWQSFFGDERLKQLIATALANNRDLRVAVLNIEQARAQYNIRDADRFPTVALAASGSRTPNSSGGITSLYTAGLAVTAWEIDLFGRIASLSQSALAQYLATEEGRKAAQISLIASVANSYLALVADEELLALTQQALTTREESQRLTKLRFDNGASSELDYSLALTLAEGWRCCWASRCRRTSCPPQPRNPWRCPSFPQAPPRKYWCTGPTSARASSN